MLKSILATLGISAPSAATPKCEQAPSALTNAAISLVAASQAAIANGRWSGDDHTRHHAVAMLELAIEDGESQQTIAGYVIGLVDEAVPAIATGEWRAGGDDLEAIMTASGLATHYDAGNDDDRQPAAAA